MTLALLVLRSTTSAIGKSAQRISERSFSNTNTVVDIYCFLPGFLILLTGVIRVWL